MQLIDQLCTLLPIGVVVVFGDVLQVRQSRFLEVLQEQRLRRLFEVVRL